MLRSTLVTHEEERKRRNVVCDAPSVLIVSQLWKTLHDFDEGLLIGPKNTRNYILYALGTRYQSTT